MKIGLLPPLELGGGPSAVSAGTTGPGLIAVTPLRASVSESDVTQSAIYGGSYVDFDHQ